ncbi:MAG: hypothetical protein IPM29_01355 [Planctomycetes bacterium]|nr:hypothetical protein [Planctomycetota bacterium]
MFSFVKSSLFLVGVGVALVTGLPAQRAPRVDVGGTVEFGRGRVEVGVSLGGDRGGLHQPTPAAPILHGEDAGCLPEFGETGYWREVRERVWVPGVERVVYVPARYEYRRDACGRLVRILVEPERHQIVCEPGYFEWRVRREWVPIHRHHQHAPVAPRVAPPFVREPLRGPSFPRDTTRHGDGWRDTGHPGARDRDTGPPDTGSRDTGRRDTGPRDTNRGDVRRRGV